MIKFIVCVIAFFCAAPVPKTPRLEPAVIEGTWECKWNGSRATVTFYPDGRYEFGFGDKPDYEGTWKLSGAWEVTITESPVGGSDGSDQSREQSLRLLFSVGAAPGKSLLVTRNYDPESPDFKTVQSFEFLRRVPQDK